MMERGERSILRKVFFFKISSKDVTLEAIRLAISQISELPFTEQGRYLPTDSEDIVLALFVESTKFPIRLQFGRIKRSDLPLVEDQGQIEPLKIAKSAGVLDWAHLIIFEDGIVAAEFNRDAPRIAKLGEYLYFKSRGIIETSPRFYPLFERSVLNELEKFSNVTMLEVEALTSDSDAIAEADPNLATAFRACRLAGQVKTSKIILKASSTDKGNVLKFLAQRLFSNQESREALKKLKLSGKTPSGTKPLDMLQDYLVSAEKFVQVNERTRAIDSSHAFAIIEKSYRENKNRFADAAIAKGMF